MEWIEVLEVVGLIGGIATVLGFLLAPMFWLGSKIDNLREDVHKESKDFHARLCIIESERKR